jgi:hypothetical protein
MNHFQYKTESFMPRTFRFEIAAAVGTPFYCASATLTRHYRVFAAALPRTHHRLSVRPTAILP